MTLAKRNRTNSDVDDRTERECTVREIIDAPMEQAQCRAMAGERPEWLVRK